MADDDPAVSVCFIVKIDDFSLGAFNSCEGLGCEVVMEQAATTVTSGNCRPGSSTPTSSSPVR